MTDAEDLSYRRYCPEFTTVTSNQPMSVSEYDITYGLVIQRITDKKYFFSTYSISLTNPYSDRFGPDDKVEFTEVFPVEKTIVVYE